MYVKLFVLLPFIIYSPTVKVLTKLTKPKKFKFLYVSLSDIVHDSDLQLQPSTCNFCQRQTESNKL